MGHDYLKGKWFSIGVIKMFQSLINVVLHNIMNVLNATELCTLKWLLFVM